ncbi:MFS transporter [Acetivibrio cellulolyticus]
MFSLKTMILTGIGSGMFHAPNNSTVIGSAPHEHRGVESGTLATMHNIGMVIGVAVSGALFSSSQSEAMNMFASQYVSDSLLKSSVFVYALHITFLAAVIVALIAIVASRKGKSKQRRYGIRK